MSLERQAIIVETLDQSFAFRVKGLKRGIGHSGVKTLKKKERQDIKFIFERIDFGAKREKKPGAGLNFP